MLNNPRIRLWQHSPQATYQTALERIAATKMKGLPICHRKIRVQVLSFTRYKGHWFGVAITPWSIFVVMACGDRQTWPTVKTTDNINIKLPTGEFTFTGMNDEFLGQYLSCSLMSPVDPNFDQSSAVEFSLTALSLMMNHSESKTASSPACSSSAKRSRRQLLFMGTDYE